MTAPECIEDHTDECSGTVMYHSSLAGTGTAVPRCESHWGKHIERHQEHQKVYPDSPIAPDWFDPEAAGERWNDDY